MESNQISNNKGMGENVLHINNGIFFSHKKERRYVVRKWVLPKIIVPRELSLSQRSVFSFIHCVCVCVCVSDMKKVKYEGRERGETRDDRNRNIW